MNNNLLLCMKRLIFVMMVKYTRSTAVSAYLLSSGTTITIEYNECELCTALYGKHHHGYAWSVSFMIVSIVFNAEQPVWRTIVRSVQYTLDQCSVWRSVKLYANFTSVRIHLSVSLLLPLHLPSPSFRGSLTSIYLSNYLSPYVIYPSVSPSPLSPCVRVCLCVRVCARLCVCALYMYLRMYTRECVRIQYLCAD